MREPSFIGIHKRRFAYCLCLAWAMTAIGQKPTNPSPPATGTFRDYQFARHLARRCVGRKDAHDFLPSHINQFPLSRADLSDLERFPWCSAHALRLRHSYKTLRYHFHRARNSVTTQSGANMIRRIAATVPINATKIAALIAIKNFSRFHTRVFCSELLVGDYFPCLVNESTRANCGLQTH
jgi:hypothetical protein